MGRPEDLLAGITRQM